MPKIKPKTTTSPRRTTSQRTPKQLQACFLPLSSIKSGHDLGRFFTFLQREKLNAWAMLPIHEPITSPYRNSGFGVAHQTELWTDLKKTFSRAQLDQARAQLTLSEADWLPEAALFSALADNFRSSDWSTWPRSIRLREPAALIQFRKLLREQIATYTELELDNLVGMWCVRHLARQARLKLIGDSPFYVDFTSFSVWWRQDLFWLDERQKPVLVSGVPNHPKEPFVRQMWGHPLYDWQNSDKVASIADFFTRRLQFLANFFDLTRLDHANGFYHYGALDPDRLKPDQLLNGPASAALDPIIFTIHSTTKMRVFFEDVAAERRALHRFMHEQKIPGMAVLPFAYHAATLSWEEDLASIADFAEPDVFYSSTHDTQTLLGWLQSLSPPQLKQLLRFNHLQIPPANFSLEFVAVQLRLLLRQNPHPTAVIIPLQDFLLQTTRLNIPGTPDAENWVYELPENF